MGIPLNEILVGDALEQLRTLPSQSVHCVVTSPPYFRLRDYGVAGQIGLEASGEEYLYRMVAVFGQVRRVLRRDGVVWLNMGDSYVGGGRGEDTGSTLQGSREHQAETRKVAPRTGIFGLKAKQLVGMPWRLALALQADGWWLRQDNIWHKRNVMPESTRDRSTRAHEYVFQLTRSANYFYDAVAVEEPQSEHERTRRLKQQERGVATVYKLRLDTLAGQPPQGKNGAARNAAARQVLAMKGTRNRRSVWSIASKPFSEAHFAVFPEGLVEPCIMAGTSEKGCCEICGAPIARQVMPSAEYAQVLRDNLGKNHNKDRAEDLRTGRYATGLQRNHNICAFYQTKGWKRTCRCTLGGGGCPLHRSRPLRRRRHDGTRRAETRSTLHRNRTQPGIRGDRAATPRPVHAGAGGGGTMSPGQLRLALGDALWTVSNRADLDCNAIYRRHYSARQCDSRQFVGPGEDVVLVTPELDALFVWRKFIDHTEPAQTGVQCAVFRNEGSVLSSHLILAAEAFAIEEWPAERRLYTFVDARKTMPKKHPGRCFLEAGWRRCGKTKGGLLIFEKLIGRTS